MDLAQFASELKALIGDGPVQLSNGQLVYPRPFVCDGSPLDCDLFLTGYNAARNTSSFWCWWDAEYGFRKQEWYEQYRCIKSKNGTRPQDLACGARPRLETIVDSLAGQHRCLETNLFAAPTKCASDLSVRDRKTAVFRFLLNAIRPKAMLLYGKQTITGFRELVCDDVWEQGTPPVDEDAHRVAIVECDIHLRSLQYVTKNHSEPSACERLAGTRLAPACSPETADAVADWFLTWSPSENTGRVRFGLVRPHLLRHNR